MSASLTAEIPARAHWTYRAILVIYAIALLMLVVGSLRLGISGVREMGFWPELDFGPGTSRLTNLTLSSEASAPLGIAQILMVLGALWGTFVKRFTPMVALTCALAIGIAICFGISGIENKADLGFVLLLVSYLILCTKVLADLSRHADQGGPIASFAAPLVPLLFGCLILLVWEAITRAFGVPTILLPSPSEIGRTFAGSIPILVADFQQTFLKSVLIGYVLGCGTGFLVAIAIDRSPFLKAGLLPLGNFVSALPLIGIAPIMVMWFGFDWPSKAAVVVVMTFFPMLVNTIAGLNASIAIERDMLRTYASSYGQTLFKLRLPAAAPFIFNALKINSTLALIGAIVAEFFGTPIVGMGFRISSEIGKLNVEMVWAEIAVAALAGSAFYGLVTLAERSVTFWHPSVRTGRT